MNGDSDRHTSGSSDRDWDQEVDQIPIIIERNGWAGEIERPQTPPLVIQERYYSSKFDQQVTTQPAYGTRSGKDFHADLVEEIDAILDDDNELRDFHRSVEQCYAIDELINEHLEVDMKNWDVPKNISEATKVPEAMEAAKREIDMIQKFGTWKLVPQSQVPSGTPIYALIWRFTQKLDRQMKARLCFPGHHQRKGIDYLNLL